MQLFAEALVLGSVAAVVGLTAAGWGVRWALDLMRGELTDGSGNFPFWVDGGPSPLTVVYAMLLTVLAAAISGVLPGLRITRNLGDRLMFRGDISWANRSKISCYLTLAAPDGRLR